MASSTRSKVEEEEEQESLKEQILIPLDEQDVAVDEGNVIPIDDVESVHPDAITKLQKFNSTLIQTNITSIVELQEPLRSISQSHVAAQQSRLEANGYQHTIGSISVVFPRDEEPSSLPVPYSFIGQSTILVDGRHRLHGLRNLAEKNNEWKKRTEKIVVTVWTLASGEALSRLDALSLGALLNELSTTVKAMSFHDRLFASVSVCRSIETRNEEAPTAGQVTEALLKGCQLGPLSRRQLYRHAQVALKIYREHSFYNSVMIAAKVTPKLSLIHLTCDALLNVEHPDIFQMCMDVLLKRLENQPPGRFDAVRSLFYQRIIEVGRNLYRTAVAADMSLPELLEQEVKMSEKLVSLRELVISRYSTFATSEKDTHWSHISRARFINKMANTLPILSGKAAKDTTKDTTDNTSEEVDRNGENGARKFNKMTEKDNNNGANEDEEEVEVEKNSNIRNSVNITDTDNNCNDDSNGEVINVAKNSERSGDDNNMRSKKALLQNQPSKKVSNIETAQCYDGKDNVSSHRGNKQRETCINTPPIIRKNISLFSTTSLKRTSTLEHNMNAFGRHSNFEMNRNDNNDNNNNNNNEDEGDNNECADQEFGHNWIQENEEESIDGGGVDVGSGNGQGIDNNVNVLNNDEDEVSKKVFVHESETATNQTDEDMSERQNSSDGNENNDHVVCLNDEDEEEEVEEVLSKKVATRFSARLKASGNAHNIEGNETVKIPVKRTNIMSDSSGDDDADVLLVVKPALVIDKGSNVNDNVIDISDDDDNKREKKGKMVCGVDNAGEEDGEGVDRNKDISHCERAPNSMASNEKVKSQKSKLREVISKAKTKQASKANRTKAVNMLKSLRKEDLTEVIKQVNDKLVTEDIGLFRGEDRCEPCVYHEFNDKSPAFVVDCYEDNPLVLKPTRLERNNLPYTPRALWPEKMAEWICNPHVFLQYIYIPLEHRAHYTLQEMKVLLDNHNAVSILGTAAHLRATRAVNAVLEKQEAGGGIGDHCGEHDGKRNYVERSIVAARGNTLPSYEYFAERRTELFHQGFTILVGLADDKHDEMFNVRFCGGEGWHSKLRGYYRENFELYNAERQKYEHAENNGTEYVPKKEFYDWEAVANEPNQPDEIPDSQDGYRFVSTNAGVTQSIEHCVETKWVVESRAMLDVRVGQCMAALNIHRNYNVDEYMHMMKTGGRWIRHGSSCCREPLHTAVSVGRRRDILGNKRYNPGYFGIVTGECDCAVWVVPYSHRQVCASSTSSIGLLSKGVHAIKVIIPPWSVFIGRGDLFHSSGGFGDVANDNGQLRYHIYILPEDVDIPCIMKTVAGFNPPFKEDYDVDSDEDVIMNVDCIDEGEEDNDEIEETGNNIGEEKEKNDVKNKKETAQKKERFGECKNYNLGENNDTGKNERRVRTPPKRRYVGGVGKSVSRPFARIRKPRKREICGRFSLEEEVDCDGSMGVSASQEF